MLVNKKENNMTKKSSIKKGKFEGVRKIILSSLVCSIMFIVLMTNFVSAADVAYIYKAKLKVDQNIVGVFHEMNLSVDLIDERYMPKSFSSYKFIFVGDERFSKVIPVDDYNSIVSNYYFGQDWGLTDFDGISNLAATFPLSVRKDDQVIQVYTQAKFPNGISIPYYYLADEDKVPAMQKIAGTYTGNEYDFGDVISYANAGTHLINGKNAKGNICFYGIVESKYWTPEARQMLKDCVNFVGTSCSKDIDCPADKIGLKYCNNSSVYQDSTDYFCSMPGDVKSKCNNNVVSNLIETCTYGCSNGNCLPQCTKDSDCAANQICSNNQCVNVICKTDSECDDANTHTFDKCNNPGTNSSTCSHTPINCLNNGECGTDGLVGNLFCQDRDVVINFVTFTCNNPGTIQSSCSNNTVIKLNKTCTDACNNGACVAITCYNDSQCDDNNVKTIDKCLNPGTGQSSCVHMPINCSLNSDCGTNGLMGNLFCQNNNVFQNFLDYTCNNPGTASASCSSATNALLNKSCTYGCNNGNCLPQCTKDSDCAANQICSNNQCVNVNCKIDSDCNDNSSSTVDKCNNPGTVQSYCTNTFVKCTLNSDCGTDGFSGNLFCLSDDSYQNFVTYKCNNPGSGTSSCTTTTNPILKQTCTSLCSNGNCIGCFSDEGCGTDEFVGEKYCQGKDIYQDFEDFSCSNSGQSNSQCLSNTMPKLIKSCADSCYNGECKNIKCTNADDCDDSNAYTIDECNNAGTTSSYCSNTPVNCLSNNDCGITGFSGQEFCLGSDVFKNYQESNCRNPGTRLSYCDISIEQKFIVDCGTGKTCSSGICMPVKCNSNGECGTNGYLNQLFCMNNNVFDKFATYTCNNPGTPISSCSSSTSDKSIKNCQYGCMNGNCLPQCNQNSDCQSGQVCLNNQCISIVCSSDNECNDNDAHSVDTCLNPGTIQSSCTHTPINCNSNAECGANGFTGNLFCQSSNIFQNFLTYTCNNPGTAQSSCSSSTNALLKQTCAYGCSNGICNNNNCVDVDQDSYDTCNPGTPGDDGKPVDCNDNNANVNPGKTEVCNLIDDDCDGLIDEGTNICGSNQLCVQGQCKPIACSANSQCGTDHFLNQLFCMNNNVFDKYLIYMCHNPGTADSMCMNHTEDKLKQTCSFGCSNGICNNNNCVDVDQDSYDTCNPGTPGDDGKPVDCNDNNANIHPTAVEVCNLIDDDCDGLIDEGGVCACNQNSDCGTNGFMNQLSCKNNSVFDKFKTYTCNNPGTPSASCSNALTDVLKQTCTQNQICSNGMCSDINIPCSTDSQCNDANTHTFDKCNNAGTPQSFCSHTPIVCLNNAECGTNGFVNGLFCQNNNVFQNFLTFTCNNPGTIQSSCDSQIAPQLKQTCSAGQTCNNGECQNVACSQNSDCGTNGNLNQLFCKDGNVFDKFKTYTCNNPGTALSSCSNALTDVLKQTCAYGCSNGNCNNNNCVDVDNDNYDTCNPGTPGDDGKPVDCNDNNANVNPGKTEVCNLIDDDCDGLIDEGGVCACNQNSDCGTNGFMNQLFCKDGNVFDKFKTYTCNNPGTPSASCSNVITDVLKQTCSQNQICSNGACVNLNIPCSTDSQCNDTNTHTFDKCNNAGTPQSFCSHTPIVCLNNAECGTNGLVGNLFCQSSNVFQNFLTFTCNNPGTINSSCDSLIAPQLKQTCAAGQTCNNGQCQNVVCSKNSDCGTDGYLNQLFCKNNNSFDKYKTYTCNNPGTSSASCSNALTDVLKQTCAYGCSNGICNNNNCVDVDNDNYDTCNPGTPGDDGNPVDCNDNNPNVHPNAVEVCNLIDDDCDGLIDEGGVCACYQNSDCGTNHFLNQLFCKNNSVFDKYVTYTCHNPGTPSNSCSSSTSDVLKQTCASNQICSDGICLDASCTMIKLWQLGKFDYQSFNLSNNEYPSNDLYFDDFNYNILGTGTLTPNMPGYMTFGKMSQVVGDGRTPTEGAKNINLLFNLDNKYRNVELIFSRYGSETNIVKLDGTVQDINSGEENVNKVNTILLDKLSSGNHSVTLTYDFGGSNNGDYIDALALYGCVDNIVCNQNSDCGTNGNLNQLFCKDGNVFDKFRTFTCNNPGTPSASCSNALTDVLKQTCSNGCTNGICNPEDTCHQCFVPNNAVFFQQAIGSSSEETLQSILNKKGFSVNVATEQSKTQTWTTNKKTRLEITYLDGHAKDTDVKFGYYINNDPSTFTQIFNRQTVSVGSKFYIEVNANTNVGFAMIFSGKKWYTDKSLNSDNKFNHFLTFDKCDTTLIGFEDLPYGGDRDFQDSVIAIKRISCDNNVVCSSDAECNDNNAGTTDKCINPGTINSYCTNTACPTGGQNSNYPSPAQCTDANWNIGVPNGVTCTGTATIAENLFQTKTGCLYTQDLLSPEVNSLNKLCQDFYGSNSYAKQATIHSCCHGTCGGVLWQPSSNSWLCNQVAPGEDSVGKTLVCATGCTVSSC